MAARLILIADWPTLLGRYGHDEAAHHALQETLEATTAAPAGTVMLMERDRRPGVDARRRLGRLERLRRTASDHRCVFVVNHRSDLAAAVEADGVQLPERGLPADVVRRSFPSLAIGRSCHDRDGLLRACRSGADWATLGPVHTPLSKALPPAVAPLGADGYDAATAEVPIPVFALGGITLRDVSRHRRVALIGSVLLNESPAQALEQLLKEGLGKLTTGTERRTK